MPVPANVSRETPGRSRRCPGCRNLYPADRAHFYMTPSTGQLLRCQGPETSNCHAAYYEARRGRPRRQRVSRRVAAMRAAAVAPPQAGAPRSFGVEIEFIGDRYGVAAAVTRAGVVCNVSGYGHRTPSSWKVVTDGSISGGGELVSPPLRGEAGLDEVRRVCEALRGHATVNVTCGLHVHHDVRDMTVPQFGRLFRFWRNCQGAVNQLVAPSRRRSRWCNPLTDGIVTAVDRMPTVDINGLRGHFTGISRYHALNVTCYPRQGTVEVRQHQGTTDADKIIAWVKFGQAVIDWARSDAPMPDTALRSARNMLALLPIDQDTRSYLEARAQQLTRPGAPSSDPEPEQSRTPVSAGGEYSTPPLGASAAEASSCSCSDCARWRAENGITRTDVFAAAGALS